MNLTGITDNMTAANSNTLGYSLANRLNAASGAWGSNSFTYDGVGNRLSDVTTTKNRQVNYGPPPTAAQPSPATPCPMPAMAITRWNS